MAGAVKTYDCFMLDRELDMLELRLHTLGPVVKTFVLVEGGQTFQGRPKPFHYHDHRKRFAPILEQYGCELIHVPVKMFPMTDSPWEIEHFQRNAILRGLKDAHPEDLILISDVDELPHPQVVEAVAVSFEHRLLPHDAVIACQQKLYSFTLNWLHTRPWYGTRMLKRRSLDMPQALRSTITPRPNERVLVDAGWSFSWMGGVEAVRAKAKAFSHIEVNRPEYLSDENIQRTIREGITLVEGDGNSYIYVDVDDTYPEYLVQHLDQYAHWLADTAITKNWAV